jgi:hypothetical protein
MNVSSAPLNRALGSVSTLPDRMADFPQRRHISEVKDFRDHDLRGQHLRAQDDNGPSTWDRVREGVRVLGSAAFVGLTIYNLYIIGGWLSNWYAKKRGEASLQANWRRLHSREWQQTGKE